MKKIVWVKEELKELSPKLQEYVAKESDREQRPCMNCNKTYYVYHSAKLFCCTSCRMNYHYNLRKSQLKSYRDQLK
jgi:protein-arginine kinase activator protein McsA